MQQESIEELVNASAELDSLFENIKMNFYSTSSDTDEDQILFILSEMQNLITYLSGMVHQLEDGTTDGQY